MTDGELTSNTMITINTRSLVKSSLAFSQDEYFVQVTENSTRPQRLVMLQVLGSDLGEHLVFRLIRTSPHFEIGPSSGIISSTGMMFDREEKSSYNLVVEVRIIFFSK